MLISLCSKDSSNLPKGFVKSLLDFGFIGVIVLGINFPVFTIITITIKMVATTATIAPTIINTIISIHKMEGVVEVIDNSHS